MSYRRTYQEVISGYETVSYSYPASQHGGRDSITVHWQEPVTITIYVDTAPFDDSVSSIKHHVDVLTGSVVATQTAQVAQKVHSANAIVKSVTDGFFTLIRSDITQQMAALNSRINSLLLSLADIKVNLVGIQQQMGMDYARITERYSRVFENLDEEMRNRVVALDEAMLRARDHLVQQEARSRDKRAAVVPTVFGGENSQGQTAVVTASIRARMNQLLTNAKAYLASERRLANGLEAILSEPREEESPTVALPALYLLADAPNSGKLEEVFLPDSDRHELTRSDVHDQLLAQFRRSELPWAPLGRQPQVERYLNALVDGLESGDAAHAARVRQTILSCWSASKPVALPC
jgi:hypothetical protein